MPTAYDIYQTYLQGAGAVIRLFEQTCGTAHLYGLPAPDLQQHTIEAQAEKITRLQAQVTRLHAELSHLRYEHGRLLRRTSELEALITRDSHNSSRPPSSDHPALKRTRSLRRPSGKRVGGQSGHPGHTRAFTARASRVVRHRPAQCHRCHATLWASQAVRHERRQVIDIVPARLKVTEHRAEVRRCRACGAMTKGQFPDGVRAAVQYGASVKARVLYLHDYQLLPYARTAEAMRELFGCTVSAGTLATMVASCAAGLVETELEIKRRLRRSRVIHADETGLRVEGQCQYVHVASTARLTHYGAAARRGRAAMDEIGILPRYRGTCVHDGWLSYTSYPRCRHALCGAHLLRELTYFTELGETTKAWAEPLRALLVEMKAEVEQAKGEGAERLRSERLAELTANYDGLVTQGLDAVDAGAQPGGKQAPNLVRRLERRKEEVLRFLTDFQVPFDNNQAERDLRMVKVRQKISGCLRSVEGASNFCRIRSYLSTMRKQGRGALQSLGRACEGRPFRPTS